MVDLRSSGSQQRHHRALTASHPKCKTQKIEASQNGKGKRELAKAEVQRILDAGFIREVTYPKWLANVVMVKKKNGKWRMCTDLNKCCSKDDFPLTRIDQNIDSATASEMMALLDCFRR
jgi:hypothetical protein